jgi:hypothetical protein
MVAWRDWRGYGDFWMIGRLYSEHAEVWDGIAAEGRPCLAAMARRFDDKYAMDEALGMRGGVRHWLDDGSKPSPSTERSAEMWLRLNPEVVTIDAAPAVSTELSPHFHDAEPYYKSTPIFPGLTSIGSPVGYNAEPTTTPAPTMTVKVSGTAAEAAQVSAGKIGYYHGDPAAPVALWNADASDIEFTVKPEPIVRVDKAAPLPDHVLLVSFEPGLRNRVMAILERMGCTVEEV